MKRPRAEGREAEAEVELPLFKLPKLSHKPKQQPKQTTRSSKKDLTAETFVDSGVVKVRTAPTSKSSKVKRKCQPIHNPSYHPIHNNPYCIHPTSFPSSTWVFPIDHFPFMLRKLMLFHQEQRYTAEAGDFTEAIDYNKIHKGFFIRRSTHLYIEPSETLSPSECKDKFGTYLDFMHPKWNHIYHLNNRIIQDEMILDAITIYGANFLFNASATDPYMVGRERVLEDSLEYPPPAAVELDEDVLLYREKCLSELEKTISMLKKVSAKRIARGDSVPKSSVPKSDAAIEPATAEEEEEMFLKAIAESEKTANEPRYVGGLVLNKAPAVAEAAEADPSAKLKETVSTTEKLKAGNVGDKLPLSIYKGLMDLSGEGTSAPKTTKLKEKVSYVPWHPTLSLPGQFEDQWAAKETAASIGVEVRRQVNWDRALIRIAKRAEVDAAAAAGDRDKVFTFLGLESDEDIAEHAPTAPTSVEGAGDEAAVISAAEPISEDSQSQGAEFTPISPMPIIEEECTIIEDAAVPTASAVPVSSAMEDSAISVSSISEDESSSSDSESEDNDSPSPMKLELIRKRKFEASAISQALLNPTGKRIVFESEDEEEAEVITEEAEESTAEETAAPAETAPATQTDASTSTDPRIVYDDLELRMNKFDLSLDVMKCDLIDLSNDLKGKMEVMALSMETMKEFFELALNLHTNSIFEMIGKKARTSWTSTGPPHDDWLALLSAAEGFKKKEREQVYHKLQSIQEEKKLKALLSWMTADRDRLKDENRKQRLQLLSEAKLGYSDLAPSGSDDCPSEEEPDLNDLRAHPPTPPTADEQPPAE